MHYISGDDFALVYVVRSKDVFPNWKFDGFNLTSLSDHEESRTKNLKLLLNYVQITEIIVCEEGSICNGM